MSNPDVRTFVIISTAHLTAMTALILDGTSASEWPCAGGPYADYGWFVYAHDEMAAWDLTGFQMISSAS